MERNQATTLVTFNGFLGSSADFSVINNLGVLPKLNLVSFNVKPSVYNFCFWEELVEKIATDLLIMTDEFQGEIIVLGYSMGGRLLLDLLQQDTLQRFNKLVFISSHMGIYEEQDILQKNQFNQKCLDKINSTTDFLNFWNGLELFSNDEPLKKSDWSKEDIEHYFNHWAYPSERHMPLQLVSEQQLYYVHGSKDLKYKQQSEKLKIEMPDVKILEIKERGHRLLDATDLKQILQFIAK